MEASRYGTTGSVVTYIDIKGGHFHLESRLERILSLEDQWWKVAMSSLVQKKRNPDCRNQPTLLTIPLEIRQQILGYVLHDSSSSSPLWLSENDGLHICPLASLRCNRQVFYDAVDTLHLNNLALSTHPESTDIYANVRCFHCLDFSRIRNIHFQINPFQYTETIPAIWNRIQLICRRMEDSPLDALTINFDGTLPRSEPPLYINEGDLDRAPLNIVLLLLPFRILSRVYSFEISVVGGPLNDPWVCNRPLQNFISRLALERTTRSCSKGLNLLQLDYQLSRTNLLWDLERLRRICEQFAEEESVYKGVGPDSSIDEMHGVYSQ